MTKRSVSENDKVNKVLSGDDLPAETGEFSLLARVKENINIQPGEVHDFFSCHAHFVKEEWRPVPLGFEDEAREHPFLETK